jgi:multidrug efflux system membrane fusion protein
VSATRTRRLVWLGAAFAAVTIGLGVFIGARQHHGAAKHAAAIPAALTAAVQRTTVTSRSVVTGTLGYSGAHAVAVTNGGVLTAVPAIGALVTRGQILYSVDDSPSLLLYGDVPAWRTYTSWDHNPGPDISELSANLAALGYLNAANQTDHATSALTGAVERWQADAHQRVTGVVSLGQVVFLPGPIRVTSVSASPGTAVAAGADLIGATGTTVGVSVDLDPATAAPLRTSDAVQVTTPDGQVRPATVTAIGTVASRAPSSSGGQPTVTVPVSVTFTPAWTPGPTAIDQAPVQVAITVQQVRDVLAVPVTALVGEPGGGYDVEVVTGQNNIFVPVTLGLFDDLSGLVEVSGAVNPGQRVVVAAA